MSTKLWLLVGLLLSGPLWRATPAYAAGNASQGGAAAATIQQLITQLGDEQYLLRQRAETQLLERGVEAFAELQAAENHHDLEIATRAKYILNQVRIEWVRPTDAADVRSIMARYGQLSQPSRLAKVALLSRLENEQGFGALCRIVRFDASTQVVRFAALAILENGFLPTERRAAAVAMLTEELGNDEVNNDQVSNGEQVPLNWVGVYVDQLQAPELLDPRWLELIDAEIELLDQATEETDQAMVLNLLRCHLNLCDELSDAEAIFASWQRRLNLSTNSDSLMISGLYQALDWIIDREQWGALRLLEEHYADSIQNQRLLVYLVAIARGRQGRSVDAEAMALQAFEQAENSDSFAGTEAEERNQCALVISEFGRHDWAEREWRQVIDSLPATDIESVQARSLIALYRISDRGEHQAAADLLTESIDAINKDDALRQLYRSSDYRGSFVRANASREYFLACHYESQQNYEKQRRHLDQAYRLSPSDAADVLIAMYRLPDPSVAYRKSTAKKLAKMKRQMEQDIKKAPRSAQGYNQWAWLISNTEGDFDKAVELSKLSLKLSPDNPSYLDTLGRCYYSAGDLENAIQVQRRAIAKYPHLMVMQRQLKLFEDELQARAGAEGAK